MYQQDMHKKAFLQYRETRSLQSVAKALGIHRNTVVKWSDADFECPYACPYHGWDKLLKKVSVVTASMNMPERKSLRRKKRPSTKSKPKKKRVLKKLTGVSRSIIEEQSGRRETEATVVRALAQDDASRMRDLQLVWNKTMSDLLGEDREGVSRTSGLRSRSTSEALAVLKDALSMMRLMEGNIGFLVNVCPFSLAKSAITTG